MRINFAEGTDIYFSSIYIKFQCCKVVLWLAPLVDMQCTQFRYEEKLYFCGRFRMRKSLFMRIVTEVTAANSFFVQKKCCWQDGFLSASQMHGYYEDACIWNCS